MPFTFAHPAIVLPGIYFSKKWVSLTGLIVGSITPDMEYFFRMRVYSNYSHTLTGIFWLNLPMALLISFIFHLLVRNQLFNHLPIYLQKRLNKFTAFNWTNYFSDYPFIVVFSVLIGVLSHIVWDGFTHEQGYFVSQITSLSKPVTISQINVPVYKLLQHGSTLLGSCLLLFAFLKMPTEQVIPAPTSKQKYWFILIAITFVILLIRFRTGVDLKQYGNLIVSGIAASLASLVLTSLVIGKKLF